LSACSANKKKKEYIQKTLFHTDCFKINDHVNMIFCMLVTHPLKSGF
jgi:hypothetical protein